MDSDFLLFVTEKDSRYLYDANTNTVHPLSERIEENFVNQIYNSTSDDELNRLIDLYPEHKDFLRYVRIWRTHSDAFRRKSRSGKIFLKSVEEAQNTQLLTSLAWDLILVTTEQCNMRCLYCVYEEGLYPNRRSHHSRYMTAESTKKAIDLYLQLNRQEKVLPFKNRALNVSFYGGEALLNWPVVKEGIAYVRNQYQGPFELHIGISTNLTLLKKEWLPFLRDNCVFLNVSIDGPEKEHDRYRRLKDGRPSFRLVEKKLKEIYYFDQDYYNKYVKANVTTNGNTDFLEVTDFFEKNDIAPHVQNASMLKDLEISDFHRIHPYEPERFRNSLIQLKQAYEDLCLKGRQFQRGEVFYAFNYDAQSTFFNVPHCLRSEKNWYTGICASGRKLCVTPDERIYMCERIGNDRPIGSLDSGVDENKLLDYFNDFFKSTEECPSCVARNHCHICPAEVDSGREDYFENRCEKARELLVKNLTNLYSLLEKKPDLFKREYEYF
ncbi:radical SAM protein [uncultured Odoribacter sp.]|uniref:radical SAM protein n=1 Tax=uncultured Odoribacter sp. TaxID=876416 RepID=UPI0026318AC9|nr:radical SAM protein [uncultured Odoribacter sp.]